MHACYAAAPCRDSFLLGADGQRRRLGVPEGDVLDALASWSPEKRAEGNQVLDDIEGQVLPYVLRTGLCCLTHYVS